MWFGAAYYPEHRDPAKWESDLDRMAEAGVNALRVGEFAWKRFEPRRGRYAFEWMERFGEQAGARGIGLLLCPPLRTAPAWLVEEDPSVLILDREGRRLAFGSRYTFCTLHPLLRERGFALAAEMARRFEPQAWILGWHLDNEYGDEPDCHCPVCTARWRAWLSRRYGTIGAMNEAWGNVFWGLEYDVFEQVPTPALTKTCGNPAHLLNWRRFRSDATVETVGLHARALRENGVKSLITTNHQALHNPRTDYFDLARILDVCGTNYYPPYGDRARVLEMGLAAARAYKGRPFQVHELRCGAHTISGEDGNTPAPGEVARLTAHAVAHGADAVFYFRWRACPFGAEQHHGAVTDYDGRPTRIYREVAETGERLRRLAPLLEGSRVVSQAAVLYDFPTRWLMETGAYWNGPTQLYMDRCRAAYSGLRAEGISVDLVGRRGPFEAYRALVVPYLAAMTDELAEALAGYVRGGGCLVWHPLCGMRDAEAACYPDRLHPLLREVFDVAITDIVTLPQDTPAVFEWDGERYGTWGLVDLLALGRKARALAGFERHHWFGGHPALVECRPGTGRVLYSAGLFDEAASGRLWKMVVADTGIRRLTPQRPPDEIEAAERTLPDGRRLLFLLNASGRTVDIAWRGEARDHWNAETIADGMLSLPPRGVRVLERLPTGDA